MTAPTNSMIAATQKIYRFALYGRRNSGKTCILAAMAMDRIANPEGLTCTWIEKPVGMSRPVGDTSDWNTDDPDAAFFHGKDWLEQAIRSLELGAVPPPNPNDRDTFRFRYEFTEANHRTFLVELIDYSGELIDPDLSDSDLARHLRQHMLSLDGILVLAESPHRGQPLGELYKELQRLQRAFADLRGEKQDGPALDCPVALLINKWDRRTESESFSSDSSDRDIEEFLSSQPEPPHRGLVHTLNGSVTEGNFKIFPVSAFGKHVSYCPTNGDSHGTAQPDRPAQVNPLCSFGLENGFVWACRRRDEIDICQFGDLASHRVWWKILQLGDRKTRRTLRDQRKI